MNVRPGSILTTPMVIALMAFALVAFLLLIDTSIMPRGTKNTNTIKKTLNTNQTTNTNPAGTTLTNSTTEGTFSTNTNVIAQ